MPERERTSPQYESFHELYKNNTTKELTQKAKSLKLTNYSKLNKKELVLAISKAELDSLWQLRNLFTDSTDFTERFIRKLKRSKNNKDFFSQLQKSAEESTKTGKPII